MSAGDNAKAAGRRGRAGPVNLTEKIARLVEERGWNLETFARVAGLHRNTLRPVLARTAKKLHNATVRKCADALGVSVHELTEWPVERLLPRVRQGLAGKIGLERLLEEAGQPELHHWAERNPERAALLSTGEIDELLSLQGTGGPLTQFGVEHFVRLIERKRELKRRLEIIAGTEYLDLVEKIVDLIFDKIQPYRPV